MNQTVALRSIVLQRPLERSEIWRYKLFPVFLLAEEKLKILHVLRLSSRLPRLGEIARGSARICKSQLFCGPSSALAGGLSGWDTAAGQAWTESPAVGTIVWTDLVIWRRLTPLDLIPRCRLDLNLLGCDPGVFGVWQVPFLDNERGNYCRNVTQIYRKMKLNYIISFYCKSHSVREEI